MKSPESAAAPPRWPELHRIGEVPDPPAFPLDVLPESLSHLANEMADSLNCAVDMPAVVMLALAGGAIANSRLLGVKASYTESAALYVCIVAPPGGAKTPILKMLRAPFDRRQTTLLEAFQAQLAVWQSKDDEEDQGEKPICERVVVADATVESLAQVLCENPRGVIMVRDELVSVVHGLNQYKGGKGADRQFYLSAWSGDTITVDRKSDKSRHGAPLLVVNPFLGLVGGVQPDIVADLRGQRTRTAPPNDGWLDRFLFSWPTTPLALGETWKTVSDASLSDWANVVDWLLRLELLEHEGRKEPRHLRLSQCGKAIWQRRTAEHAAELNNERFPEHLLGAWAKLRAYAVRLTLIVHLLRMACGEVADDEVDGESMERAWKLVDYFKGHVRRVYAEMDADDRIAGLRKLVRWIEKSQASQFRQNDAYQDLKGTFRTVADLEPVLERAQNRGYIRPVLEPERKGPGRKPSTLFEVNPAALRGNADHSGDSGERSADGDAAKSPPSS
ncbi:MAG TPA: DUF3987 domain-containing protein [Gemmataceae bacterium]|jgi:hypothetical protein|nr:DUF3987 domain-containing protein [Gemmataceae bacterium]